MTQEKFKALNEGLTMITGGSYDDIIDRTLTHLVNSAIKGGSVLLIIDNEDDVHVYEKLKQYNYNQSNLTIYLNTNNHSDAHIVEVTSPQEGLKAIFHINDISKPLNLDYYRSLVPDIPTYYMLHEDFYYGDTVFDDLQVNSQRVTDAQLVLSRVHGQFISIIYDGQMTVISDYEQLKEYLKLIDMSDALQGYRRRNPSSDFMYWDLEQCIGLVKTLSDNLGINS